MQDNSLNEDIITPEPEEESESTSAVTDQPEELVEEASDAAEDKSSESESATQPEKDILSEVLEYLKMFLLVLVIAILITQFVIQRNTVKGLSMFPTLHDGDELFVEKVSRYFGAINRYDIITLDTHNLEHETPNRVIKRVVALPGETVEIKDGVVFVNGQELEEPYLDQSVTTSPRNPAFTKISLGEDEYYCLGDNRNNSNDSRSFGPVPARNILGKLLVRFYPFDSFGKP